MSKTEPIILQAETLEGKINEITDRLEQGITELFNSDRYKEYLRVMRHRTKYLRPIPFRSLLSATASREQSAQSRGNGQDR